MDYQQGNKRIAENTFIIYGRLAITMLIGLLTSRLILQALGVSDLGLYNVVGGIVGLFTFIFSSLSATTTRFINVEMGKPDGDLNSVFNICNVIHIGMALLILLIAEVGGIYYINHYLNVEPGKEADAMFVYQVAIFTSCLGITNVPYSSLFNATEKFLFTSVVNIGLKLFQLICVIFLLHFGGNRLRAWALISTLSTIVSYFIYHVYCIKYWPKVIKWKFVRQKHLYKEALVFNNYNILSTMALMGRSQGSSMLINYFFGTTVNGAYAIAKSVEGYVMAFAGNFDGAAGPQITQSFSAGDMSRATYLVCRIGKYCILLMLVAFFPLMAELEFVLDVWLKDVPEGALEFCQMTLFVALVSATSGGIVHIIHASGKIATFKITFSVLMISCLPIGYWMFAVGMPAYWLVGLFAAVDLVWRIIQLFFMQKLIHFPAIEYVKQAFWPPIKASIPVLFFIALTALIPVNNFIWHLSRFVLVLGVTLLSCGFIGLSGKERGMVLQALKNKLTHEQ